MKLLKELKEAFKVPLVLHWSALILLALFIMSYGIFFGLIYCSIIIGSVLLHEYAHVWIAQRNKAKVVKVVIMALGAGAMIEPSAFIGKFKNELKCAIAGPAASLLLAFIFYWPALWATPKTLLAAILGYTFLINTAMFIFNLLPIYPMDGGRVLNATLALIFSKFRGKVSGGILAVKVSSIVAYVLSGIGLVACALYGLYWMAIMFVLIILFTKINKKAVIDQYNKYDPALTDH